MMEDWQLVNNCFGLQFTEVKLKDDVLAFTFDKGILHIFDDGQDCCEHRYMATDDDLPYFAGATLLGVGVEGGPSVDGEMDDNEHEQQFLHVKTSKGSFTMSNHNEHNGYYGGFGLRARFIAGLETP